MTATNLNDIFEPGLLAVAIGKGLVSLQIHPTLPLSILNYTPECQYSRAWDEVTTQCRGLIYNSNTGDVVARPFPKFFNYGEVDQYDGLPTGDPIVSEKMDGSLGIIYTYEGQTAVATRGSFTSDQAVWATKWLADNFPDFAQPEGVTTLVEIIYPQNRIVVDYKGNEGLVLLGAIDNATGADIPILDVAAWAKTKWWYGPVANHYEYHSVDDAVALATGDEFEDAEGVVLCWPRKDGPSFRLKVKHPRYIELHRIVTNLSTRSVHEALANGTFDDLIAVTPDEFHPWVRNVADDLTARFTDILWDAKDGLSDARMNARLKSTDGEYTRKDLAESIKFYAGAYSGLCFALEDGKDISARIWDMIRPEREMAVILEDNNV
jgi:RNA ligase